MPVAFLRAKSEAKKNFALGRVEIELLSKFGVSLYRAARFLYPVARRAI